ncbi:secreted protein containing DUF187 [Candidatus Omnitrophus magneticus]|uniref:Secreted protein containing DUF187 n=1 Tax=Candidatus Omnitrophus magneticus TaxID=1609969 RepID=A0A0F0CL48_9BACT|nr:secreted protein containing DUF187 [Candidatus Omnitrophus magneticus]
MLFLHYSRKSNSKLKTIIFLSVLFLYCFNSRTAYSKESYDEDTAAFENTTHIGTWVTVFSKEEILYNLKNADKLIKNCKALGINHIYLQIYRADTAYYNSTVLPNDAYSKMLTATGGSDPIEHIISQAHANGIKVYAWLNILSISQNAQGNIIKKYGQSVLTLDRFGRTSLIRGERNEMDKYYIREDQLFLEPGDSRVRQYITSIVSEILKRYPRMDGIHLDYIRYPTAMPFPLGSRFDSHGLSYGYNKINIQNFKQATGLDPSTMPKTRDNFARWDEWRRMQINNLVKEISKIVRNTYPDKKISCAIVPSIDRTYFSTFQNWTYWLKEKFVDYVVLMNYSEDTHLVEMNSKAMLAQTSNSKVHVGIGAHLFSERPSILAEQINTLKELYPGGIAIFSYDDLIKNPSLKKIMEEMAL